MKKALDAAAVIATITIAGWNYQQNKEIELSDLAMENMEAAVEQVFRVIKTFHNLIYKS